MSRNNTILLVALLIQIALIGFQQVGPSDASSSVERGMLLGELATDGVNRLVLEEPKGEQPRVTLVRGADGWTVAERWDHPADGDKVDELLRELAALEIADVVSTTGLHAVDLGVGDDEFTKRVTIGTASGDKVLMLGTSGRGNSTHARLAGSDEIVAVRNFSTWRVNPRPDGWVQRTVVDLDAGSVAQMVLEMPEQTLTFTRSDGEVEGTAAWLLSDGERSAGVDAEVVDPLLAKAVKVTASKVLGESSPIAEPLLTVALSTADGVTRYMLGRGADDETFELAVDGSGHQLQIGKWAVGALLEADFEALAPAEEPPEQE